MGHLFLRSLCRAHESIIAGKELWDAGTTTEIVTMKVPLLQSNLPGQYGVICVNVGDCKCFHWSLKGGFIREVTHSARDYDNNLNDPGGRLGQHVGKFGFPDLRNLKLYFAVCNPGDLIVLMTDGIHDNLDPRIQGKSPSDLGLEQSNWSDIPREELKRLSSVYQVQQLECVILDCPLQFNYKESKLLNSVSALPSCDLVVERLVNFALNVTEKSRSFMEANPRADQPEISSQFPGKMDHASAVAFFI